MRRLLSFRPGTSVLLASSLVAIATATLWAQKPVLTSHVPRLVKEGNASRLGVKAPSEPLQLVLSLPLRNQDALNALLADLYNPASTNYRKWLTPAQFDAQFGPTAEDYASLVTWARSNALDIVEKSANHHILTVQASTALINRAFHVTETNYHDSVRNRDFIAPDREPTTDLAIPLLAISGLETSNPRVNHYKKGPDAPATDTLAALSHTYLAGFSAPTPQITGSGPGNTYLPSDMRAAYYGGGSLTGTGQSVAIFSYDGYIASDLTLWYTHTGVSQTNLPPVTNVLVGGFSGACQLDTPCDDGEQILDMLQVRGMAPGLSNVYFYESLSAVAELTQMASDDEASVITSSWGGGDFGPACDPIFLQMAAQGQTYLNATGDSGGFNGFTYLPPSSDPYIVQVGGTDLTTTGAGGPWASETAWADSGGGFFDPNILIPSWQTPTGIITSTNKGSTTLRNSPDLAAEANFDNTTVINGTFSTGYGGTSYATPRIAGYIALANQQSVAAGTGTVGFIDAALYDYGQRTTASTTYHDITSGSAPASTSYNGVKVSYSSTAGYDLTTGWGSPNGTGLITALTGPNFAVTTDATSYLVVQGSTATVNVMLTPVDGFTATPTFTVTNLPAGVTASVASTGTNTYAVTLTAAAGSANASTTATITAVSGTITHSGPFIVNVAKRAGFDFSLSATAASAQQTGTAISNITLTSGGGYAGGFNLSVSNLPTGVTASYAATVAPGATTMALLPTLSAAPGTYTVLLTANISGSVSHTIPVTLTVTGVTSVLPDGDFESATSPWTFTSSLGGAYLCNESCGFFQHGGSNFAYLNGFGATDTDVLSQSVTLSGGTTSATLNFWLMIGTAETSTSAKNDNLTVALYNSSGTLLTTLATFSNLTHVNSYVLYSYDMSAYLGQTVTLKFTGVENSSKATAFLLDDISVVVK